MIRIACLLVPMGVALLFLVSLVSSAPPEGIPVAAPAALKEEIERVSSEIDKTFADALSEARSIPNGAGYRSKRVETLGKLLLFDKQLSIGEKRTCWPEPEIRQNMSKEIGNLRLTNDEEDQLVAFLKTLTDGYMLKRRLSKNELANWYSL